MPRLVSLFLTAHPEGGWLPPDRAADLPACYGIRCARLVPAADEQTAVTAAAVWDGPVAMKAYWPELVHKSDVGGVLLNLSGPDKVRAGWRQLRERFGERLAGVAVQEMAPDGVELLAGVDSDAVFGPLVAFGIGGTATDLAADRDQPPDRRPGRCDGGGLPYPGRTPHSDRSVSSPPALNPARTPTTTEQESS